MKPLQRYEFGHALLDQQIFTLCVILVSIRIILMGNLLV